MSMNPAPSIFPRLQASGPPLERGRSYGRLAQRQIHGSIQGYAAVFRHYQGWDWNQVQSRATVFMPIIEAFSPATAQEIVGIADGAGVEVADILALNTRSEIMFTSGDPANIPTECTSFCLTPEVTASKRLIAGQNWDWLLHARQTSVVLEVRREDGPDFITLVEAGLLAKVGLNQSGVGICTNTLISSHPEGRPAVPYHVLLRSVLDSESGEEAAKRIIEASRANSANYLIVDDSGFCQDLETTPVAGGVERMAPHAGVITHANHFLKAELTARDVYVERKRHTFDRLRSIDRSLRTAGPHSLDTVKSALTDHSFEPNSVCQHPNMDLPEPERTCTVAGAILDVTERTMHVAAGNPCEADWKSYGLAR